MGSNKRGRVIKRSDNYITNKESLYLLMLLYTNGRARRINLGGPVDKSVTIVRLQANVFYFESLQQTHA